MSLPLSTPGQRQPTPKYLRRSGGLLRGVPPDRSDTCGLGCHHLPFGIEKRIHAERDVVPATGTARPRRAGHPRYLLAGPPSALKRGTEAAGARASVLGRVFLGHPERVDEFLQPRVGR